MTFPLMKDNTILALLEGPKQKQNQAEPEGTDHIKPLERKATKRHLESTSGMENCTTLSARSPAAHFDEFVYSAQVTLPEDSDQLRLHRHSATSPLGWKATKATAPGAQQLTLMSSSTLHRSHYLRNQTNSGYIATWLHRHSVGTPPRPQRPEPSNSL